MWQFSTNVDENMNPVLQRFFFEDLLIKRNHMSSPAPWRNEQRQTASHTSLYSCTFQCFQSSHKKTSLSVYLPKVCFGNKSQQFSLISQLAPVSLLPSLSAGFQKKKISPWRKRQCIRQQLKEVCNSERKSSFMQMYFARQNWHFVPNSQVYQLSLFMLKMASINRLHWLPFILLV